jgi:putative phosphoribosyl transferase
MAGSLRPIEALFLQANEARRLEQLSQAGRFVIRADPGRRDHRCKHCCRSIAVDNAGTMPNKPPFRDRRHVGDVLARRLRHHAQEADAIVLALPRGGVPVVYAVAKRLGIALDVLIVRKLGMPRHAECAMGAVGSGGVRVLQPGVPGLMGVSAQDVEAATMRELAELTRREQAYRGSRPPLALGGRSVILVDDGVATGSTVRAGIEVMRRMRPRALALAVPVAPPGTARLLATLVDELVCLATPASFRSVGQWYDTFDQVDDAQVKALLAAAWHDAAPSLDDGKD